MEREPETVLNVQPEAFHQAIVDLERDGYRLLMIKPADSPCEAILKKPARQQGRNQDVVIRIATGESAKDQSSLTADSYALADARASANEWHQGRAGMMYRDLIPDRLGGALIASHIRILEGGPVPDRVHFHKIEFQIIFCLKGAIRVVYEDQGPPFWLSAGDVVLQPPEIRHRVLEAEAGSEVIEITLPAEHETWFDHEMNLPNSINRSDRHFGGQRFYLHRPGAGSRERFEKDGITFERTEIPGLSTAVATGEMKNLVDATLHPGPGCIVLIDGTGILVELSEALAK